MPGKSFWKLKILSEGRKTEAGKTKTEPTETKLKFAKNYFQEGVKFLLNWKYGIVGVMLSSKSDNKSIFSSLLPQTFADEICYQSYSCRH
jgi:hypothetical protein